MLKLSFPFKNDIRSSKEGRDVIRLVEPFIGFYFIKSMKLLTASVASAYLNAIFESPTRNFLILRNWSAWVRRQNCPIDNVFHNSFSLIAL